MKKISYKLTYLIVLFLLGTERTLAAGSTSTCLGPWAKNNLCNLQDLLDKKILPFAFGAVGAIFVILFLVGGVQYLTSAGNEEASTKAKKLLTDAMIGLVIVLASWAVANWILNGLGGEANFGN